MSNHWDRRWYDQEIYCHRLLEHIKDMPQPELREFCARVLIHFADRLRKEISRKGANTMGVNSIGAPAISSLYKFGEKRRRWYDQEPVTQKAVSLLYTLPRDGLSALGFKLGDTFGLLQVYAAVCDQVDQTPDMKEMTNICTTSLQAGVKEAEEVLVDIVGKDLYESISRPYLS
jgi:hypothetical protein